MMLYLSSGHRRQPSSADHRRAGRGDRHHHPAHPLAADPRPAPPPRAARPHRSLRRAHRGPAAAILRLQEQGFSLESLGVLFDALQAGRSLAGRPRAPRAHGRGRHGPDTGTDSAELYGFAELQPATAWRRGSYGPSSRWCPPRCGTRARPPRPQPGPRRSAVRSVGSPAVPDPPAVPLLPWDEAPDPGAAVAVTTRHGGVSVAPYDTPEPRPARGRRPRDRGRQPGPGRRRVRRRARHVGLRPPGARRGSGDRRPGGPGPRHPAPRRTPSPTPTSS